MISNTSLNHLEHVVYRCMFKGRFTYTTYVNLCLDISPL